MRLLYVDLLSGAAGDMLLGALVDCGFPVSLLEEKLRTLPIEHIHLKVEKTSRSGISGTKVTPECGHSHEHRHLEDILAILRKGDIELGVYDRCEKVFDRLATAEAKVHGIPKDHVHFHEIGALDSIVDVLGVCMALDYFKVDKVLFSTLTDGYGTIKVAHGIMPVPVPATAVMMEGFAVKSLPIATELLTPTGAALLTALGEQSVAGCEGVVATMGYGCGSKVFEEHPNFLRVTLYDTTDEPLMVSDQILLCETDMDHITGEVMGDVASVLLDAGALDVSWIPVYMKKGRPGYRLSVMVYESAAQHLVDCIMVHTRTLGVRIQKVSRITAKRVSSKSVLAGSECNEKRCTYKDMEFIKPEYESIAAIARKNGCSVIELMEEYIRVHA